MPRTFVWFSGSLELPGDGDAGARQAERPRYTRPSCATARECACHAAAARAPESPARDCPPGTGRLRRRSPPASTATMPLTMQIATLPRLTRTPTPELIEHLEDAVA